MNTTLGRALGLSLGFLTLATTPRIYANPVDPGQQIQYYVTGDEDRNKPIDGSLVAKTTRDLTFVYSTSEVPSTLTKVLPFENLVYRNSKTNFLTFVFRPVGDLGVAYNEGWSISASNFDNFDMNFHGGGDLTVTRNFSGGLDLQQLLPGNGAVPQFTVETNARQFDQKGSVDLVLSDDFIFPPDQMVRTGQARQSYNGMYEPTAESGSVAVPLPPAVYGGLAMLGIVCVMVTRRRWA